jgi:hypothetical protein
MFFLWHTFEQANSVHPQQLQDLGDPELSATRLKQKADSLSSSPKTFPKEQCIKAWGKQQSERLIAGLYTI